MTPFQIRLLQRDDQSRLLLFEQANRAWFEQHIDSRGDAFYSDDGVREHILSFLDDYARGTRHPCVIIGEDGTIVGRANIKDIGAHAGAGEIGYRIAASHVGRGLAVAAVRFMITMAQQRWKLDQLVARVHTGNAASMRVLEKCGFQRRSMQATCTADASSGADAHEFFLNLHGQQDA